MPPTTLEMMAPIRPPTIGGHQKGGAAPTVVVAAPVIVAGSGTSPGCLHACSCRTPLGFATRDDQRRLYTGGSPPPQRGRRAPCVDQFCQHKCRQGVEGFQVRPGPDSCGGPKGGGPGRLSASLTAVTTSRS